MVEWINKQVLAHRKALHNNKHYESLVIASNSLGTTAAIASKHPTKLSSDLNGETKKLASITR